MQRLESGADPSDRSPVQLQAWLAAIVEPFIYRSQAAQQSLRLDLPSDLPVFLIDLEMLKRIVTELVNNACKYTPAGHEITLRLRLTPDWLVLSVSNTGIEIPKDALPRLFEKFYRVPDAAVAQQTGTGLGLALVQQLVKRLEGRIRVTSQQNLTTLTVDLPRLEAEDSPNDSRFYYSRMSARSVRDRGLSASRFELFDSTYQAALAPTSSAWVSRHI
ncbi:MAG: ATP-binding protein [Leptolyngbyaceae cyanobacterium SM1_3_5]|nr:ATP-binding protein [Leptolyngbyaceae cyanobacterium SM1_3_5]